MVERVFGTAKARNWRPHSNYQFQCGAMLEALPAIIAAASKPMEQIDKISILDARGLHGAQGGAEDAQGGGNLADAAVAAALRYRVGGPLIDGLLAGAPAPAPAPKTSDKPKD